MWFYSIWPCLTCGALGKEGQTLWQHDQGSSSLQGSESEQFSFHGPQDPAATTQLCHQSAKAATDTTKWMGRPVSNKTLLQKRTAGQPTGHSLPSPVPQESCICCLT